MSKKKTKVIVLPPDKMDTKTRNRAMAEHAKLLHDIANAKDSFVKVAARLARMQETGWWGGVTDENHKGGYSDWDAYKIAVLGEMGKSKFHELIAVHRLSQGDRPLQPSTIKQMGIKRAAEVARLRPDQRTPDLITIAQTKTVARVKAEVQSILNKDLPKDKQKEPSVSFVRMFTPEIIERYEELETRAVWMEGICDHDPTLTAKQKFMLAMIDNFEANHVFELEEADARKAQSAQADGVEAIHETARWAGRKALPAAVAP